MNPVNTLPLYVLKVDMNAYRKLPAYFTPLRPKLFCMIIFIVLTLKALLKKFLDFLPDVLHWRSVFWDAAPCSVVETDRRFRYVYCLYYHGNESVSTSETLVNF
jgi:hypothetical protein